MQEGMNIKEKIRQLRDLRYSSEAADVSDLSEGLTQADDFKELCLELAEEAVEREAMAEAIETRIKDLQSRKLRVTQSADTLRNIVLQGMDIRGERTIASPALTLSVANRAPDVKVTDEALIPSRFFIPQPPKLDKKALREAILTDGEVVEGASVGNGSVSLTIRRK